MFRLYAMVAVVLFVVGAAGVSTINRATNYTPAKASVFLIDRTCDIIETVTTPDGQKSSSTYDGECKSAENSGARNFFTSAACDRPRLSRQRSKISSSPVSVCKVCKAASSQTVNCHRAPEIPRVIFTGDGLIFLLMFL